MDSVAVKNEEQSKRAKLLSCFKEDSSLSAAIAALPGAIELKDESELRKMFRPTPTDCAMKKQLWTKFYDCEVSGDFRIKMTDIYGGICDNAYFYNHFLKQPIRVAWLVSPPIDSGALLEAAFMHSFERVIEGILNMPVTEKSAPVILSAFKYFADRHLGPIVHKVESKNLNVELTGSTQVTDSVSRSDLMEKIKELESVLNKPKVIDVTPE